MEDGIMDLDRDRRYIVCGVQCLAQKQSRHHRVHCLLALSWLMKVVPADVVYLTVPPSCHPHP